MGRASKEKWKKRVLADKIFEAKNEKQKNYLMFLGFIALAVFAAFTIFGWYSTLTTNKKSIGGGNVAVVETNHGTFNIKLYENEAPRTVAHFKELVSQGFYDGLTFHRVIKDFVIQGGKQDGVSEIEEDQNDLKNGRGFVSMAKASPGGQLSTKVGNQFFINLVDNEFLDAPGNRFYPFGEIVEGMDVVDEIANVPVEGESPLEDVIIKSIRLEK